MCFDFFKKKPINWEHSNKVAILFGIDNYPETENDLDFCLSDLERSKSNLLNKGFQIREFRDSNFTRKAWREQLTYAFTNARSGDRIWIDDSSHGSYRKDINNDEEDGYDETICAYDGDILDDETNELCKLIPEGVTVVFFLDCCFSGTATRNPGNQEGRKVRFKPPKGKFRAYKRIKRAVIPDYNRIVISACLENESAEEGIINNVGTGVAHFYLWYVYTDGITWDEWFKKLRILLPNKNFSQTPTLEIDENRLNDIAIP